MAGQGRTPHHAPSDQEKDAFIRNMISLAEHHAHASRMMKLSLLNSLLLVHWGAIVSVAAFLAATKSPALAQEKWHISLIFILHLLGIFSCFIAKGLSSWRDYIISKSYRSQLRDALSSGGHLIWDNTNAENGSTLSAAFAIMVAFSVVAMCAGLGLSIALVVSQITK